MILGGHSFKHYLTPAAEIGTTFFFVMQQICSVSVNQHFVSFQISENKQGLIGSDMQTIKISCHSRDLRQDKHYDLRLNVSTSVCSAKRTEITKKYKVTKELKL